MSEPTLYEAVYIMNVSVSEEEAEELIGILEAEVEEVGGEVLGTRDFRTRRLAYPIDGQTHGTYKLMYFYGTGAVVDHILAEMGIRQQILRARIFVANMQAVVGGLQPGGDKELAAAAEAAKAAREAEAAEAAAAAKAAEEAEAAKAAEAAEAAEATEAVEAEVAQEAPVAEEAPAEEPASEAGESEEADESADSDEAGSDDEAPATEE